GAQRLGSARHARQRVGVVPRALRPRGLRRVPGAARRRLERPGVELSRRCAAAQPPDLRDRGRRLPGGALAAMTRRGCGGRRGRGRHRLRWGRWTRPSPAAVGEVDEAVTGCGGGGGRGRHRPRWRDVDEPRYRPRWATWMTTLRRTP